MFFTSFKRVFKSGWASFSRDGGMIAANIFILAMAVSVFTSLFFLKDISNFLISEIEAKVDIAVYFEYEVTEDEILQVKDQISEIPEVKEIKYVSQDEALETFIERHQDDPTLMSSLEEVGVNPFLASLDIKSYNPGQYAAIAEILENSLFFNKIENIDYNEREPVIKRIFALTSAMNMVGIILSVILAALAVLVVFNTIRLAIYNFKEEIKIQRLVGASSWFIRGPFLVQGAVSGFFAALICLGLFALVCWGLNATVENIFSGLSLLDMFVSNLWWILLIQLVGGILLGTISSLIAVRRHLNV